MKFEAIKKGQKVWVYLPSHKRQKMGVWEVESKTCIHVVTEKHESYFVHPRQLARIKKKRKAEIIEIAYEYLAKTQLEATLKKLDQATRTLEQIAEFKINRETFEKIGANGLTDIMLMMRALCQETLNVIRNEK